MENYPTIKKDLNILILAPHYKYFVKDSVEAMSQYVNNINMITSHNRFAEISKYLPFEGYLAHVRKFTADQLLDLEELPKNIEVYMLSMLYFIPDGNNRTLGDSIFKNLDRLFQKKGIEFDVIHAHFTWPYGYAAVKLGKKYNIPVIVTIHEDRDWIIREYHSNNDKIYETWKNADALIRVNKIDSALLKSFNNNVYTIPNGFNPNELFLIDKFDARKRLDLPLDKKIIFSLGNLEERKGFQYLMDAMKYVTNKRDDVVCIIGGTGPIKKKLEKKIYDLKLNHCIKLIGFIPNNKIIYYYNSADVFVLPSLSEGNPTVMFESLGCGKPFVSTRVGGVPEIITCDDYGLLCEPGDSKDLAEKILKALDKDWGNEKIKNYAEQFTWDNIALETLKIYNNYVN